MTDSFSSAIDTRELRNAFGRFPTGVTVVTTRETGGIPRGFTANSFTSVSLDPPLLLICIDKRAASLPVFLESGEFAINVLGQDQKTIAGLFATRRADKFDLTSWRASNTGMPLIDDAVAWFDCNREQYLDAGDHVILIGRVNEFGYRDGRPLGYVAGGYFSLGLEQSIVDVVNRASGVTIGAILHQHGALLLEGDPDSQRLSLPAIHGDATRPSIAGLINKLSADTFSVSIEFLFAVYEDLKSGRHVISYRGEARGEAPHGMRFYPFDDIPWDRLVDDATQSMLKRYLRESKFGKFAVYMGDDVKGTVKVIDDPPQ